MKLDDLPVEALLSIFEMLDTVEVVKTFGLVNKQLSHLVLSPDFWCSRVSGLPQCLIQRASSSPGLYPKLWYGLYKTNLVTNANWGNAASHRSWFRTAAHSSGWRVTLHGGHGWVRECPPVGMRDISSDIRSLPSFPAAYEPCADEVLASSYEWSELMQPVDLVKQLCIRGMTRREAEQYLDGGPDLTFTVWYGGRLDCESVAHVQVVLDDGTDVMPPYTGRREFPWNRSAIAHWSSGQLATTQNTWLCASYTFKGYQPGVRRALVVLRGKDGRFWAGHYGSKFAAPELLFGGGRS